MVNFTWVLTTVIVEAQYGAGRVRSREETWDAPERGSERHRVEAAIMNQ